MITTQQIVAVIAFSLFLSGFCHYTCPFESTLACQMCAWRYDSPSSLQITKRLGRIITETGRAINTTGRLCCEVSRSHCQVELGYHFYTQQHHESWLLLAETMQSLCGYLPDSRIISGLELCEYGRGTFTCNRQKELEGSLVWAKLWENTILSPEVQQLCSIHRQLQDPTMVVKQI